MEKQLLNYESPRPKPKKIKRRLGNFSIVTGFSGWAAIWLNWLAFIDWPDLLTRQRMRRDWVCICLSVVVFTIVGVGLIGGWYMAERDRRLILMLSSVLNAFWFLFAIALIAVLLNCRGIQAQDIFGSN